MCRKQRSPLQEPSVGEMKPSRKSQQLKQGWRPFEESTGGAWSGTSRRPRSPPARCWGGPSLGALSAARGAAPRDAAFLEAEESQKAQGLLASLEEVLDEEAKSDAEKAEQEAVGAAEVKDEEADGPAGAGDSVRVKRQRSEEGDGQSGVDVLDAGQAVAAAPWHRIPGQTPA